MLANRNAVGIGFIFALAVAAIPTMTTTEASAQRKGGGAMRPPTGGGGGAYRPPTGGGGGAYRPPTGGGYRPSGGGGYRYGSTPSYYRTSPSFGGYYDALGYSQNPFYNGYYDNLFPSRNYYGGTYYYNTPSYDYSYAPTYGGNSSAAGGLPSPDLYYNYHALPATSNANPTDNSAAVRVLVPDASAKVWFDGNITKQTGTDRYFYTGQLDPANAPYTYRVRASWLQNGEEMIQERAVSVTPGQTAIADFR